MTLRQSFEFALIECNKLKAPSILLEDFIYLFNKAIQQYINSVYNRVEYNQQSSDDLNVLQTTSIIDVGEDVVPEPRFNDTIWKLQLPKDYVHLLNCIAEFSGNNLKSKCDDTKTITAPCQRLTADLYPGILNNYYMRPSHKKPYYYIINNNIQNEIPTNDKMDNEVGYRPEYEQITEEPIPETPTFPSLTDTKNHRFLALKEKGSRIANQSVVNIEIHTGSSNWKLKKLYVTYIKAPKYYSMTQDQVLAIDDDTPILEFPDYVCYEIINIYVRLFLENASDPRLQTNVPINQTIAVPGN